jgi:hypothetical protein
MPGVDSFGVDSSRRTRPLAHTEDPMPSLAANCLTLAYERFGDPAAPPVLLMRLDAIEKHTAR